MKQGRALSEVLTELQRQNAAKQDFIGPAQAFTLRPDGSTFEIVHSSVLLQSISNLWISESAVETEWVRLSTKRSSAETPSEFAISTSVSTLGDLAEVSILARLSLEMPILSQKNSWEYSGVEFAMVWALFRGRRISTWNLFSYGKSYIIRAWKKVKETRKPYPTDLTDTQWGDHELQHVGWVNKGRCNNGAAG